MSLVSLSAVVFVARIPRTGPWRALLVGAPALVAASALYVLVRISAYEPEENDFFDIAVSLQPGLFLTLAASATCVVVATKAIKKERARAGRPQI